MSEKRVREERDDRRGGRSKKKAKEKLMDESNQTEEERRELRMQQRALKQAVIEQRADIADPTKANMRELAKRNSKCFENVRYTREAVADAENLKLISEAASGQVKMVTQGALGIDMEKFTADLRSHFLSVSDDGDATESFNWAMLGANVAYLYHTVPPAAGFMMGPLDKPAKGPRASNKARERKPTDDDAEEVVPDTQEPEIGKKAKHKKDQTEMRISRMRAHESKKPRQKQDMFEALFNPRSFTQTVENVFDFSFFVKSGEGVISVDEDTGLPTVLFKQQCGGDEDPNLSAKQWLFTITPAEFREMMELYSLEEPNIRHRDEGPKSDYYDPLVHGVRDSDRQ